MEYDSAIDTKTHICNVNEAISAFCYSLKLQGAVHDKSKLGPNEKPIFDIVTPKLKSLTYGSNEYKESLAEMGDALSHHYRVNKHHPEHHVSGIAGMTLMDVVEMFCDWKAATLRHADGDMNKSIDINVKRFGISPQLESIFRNSVDSF